MEHMKRILCFIILSAIIILPSCSTKNDNADSESTSPGVSESETTAKENLDDLEEYNFEGKTFTVISRSIPNSVVKQIVAGDDELSEVINDAVYKRNLKISERFNVKIESIEYREEEFESPFKLSINAGDDLFQFTAMHIIHSGVYATSGLLTDWNLIPNIDLTKPWWNQTVVKNMQIGGKLYLEQNDIPTYTVICNNHIMFYNKKIATDFSLPNLYDMVRGGKWTMDKLAEYAKLAVNDLNGDSTMDTSDQWGLIASTGSTSTLLASCNQPIMEMDCEGLPALVLNSAKTSSIVEKVYDLCISSEATLMKPISEEDAFCRLFRDGKSLFYNGYINNCAVLRDMEDEFGLLPPPKFDEAQEGYHAQIQGNSDTVGVPKSAKAEDYEFIGTIVEAMAAESYKTVRPAIYETTLKSKYSRDIDSEEMLDLVSTNIFIDFGFVYHNWKGFAFPIWDLMEAKNKNFASYYDKKLKTAQSNYDEVIKTLLELE